MAGHTEDPMPQISVLSKTAFDHARSLTRSAGPSLTIAFFDLTGSTVSTIRAGNAAATQRSLDFTSLADHVCREFGGTLVKTLGDGAFVCFDDGLAACRAALNLCYAAMEANIDMTAGLTIGRPTRVELASGGFDLLGDVVNRAARIQGLALPGQVLIDEALHTALQADLNA